MRIENQEAIEYLEEESYRLMVRDVLHEAESIYIDVLYEQCDLIMQWND